MSGEKDSQKIEDFLKEIGFREGEDYFAIYPFTDRDFKDELTKADIEIQDLSVEEFKAIIKKAFAKKDKEIKNLINEWWDKKKEESQNWIARNMNSEDFEVWFEQLKLQQHEIFIKND